MMREKFNRVLITGASGMLGKAFQEVLNLKYPDADVKALSSKVLDVTDHDEVMSYIQYNPDLIIHTAAKVDANFCEDHYEQAKNIRVKITLEALF